jgi:hypothetical protein
MFNLTEAFKEGYELYLEEQTQKDFVQAFSILEESQKQAEGAFKTVQNYFKLYALSEQENLTETEEKGPGEGKAPKKDEQEAKEVKMTTAQFVDTLKSMVGLISDPRAGLGTFAPQDAYVQVTKVSEMRFPQNIIFFVKTLVDWIVNVIKRFIGHFSNVIRTFFGLKTIDDEFNKDDLRVKFEKTRTIEQRLTPLTKSNLGPSKMFTFYDLDAKRDMEIMKSINDSQVLFGKGNSLLESEMSVQVVSIDLSKDMDDLFLLTQHFLDLFDNAYGSNGEHLFETTDMELLLGMFRETIDGILGNKIKTYAISGKLASLEVVDADRLKNNLILTNTNIENLKRVYIQTENKITNTLMAIQKGQLLASSKLGDAYKFFSASTYNSMIKIIQALEPRITNISKVEKQMTDMQSRFDKLVMELNKLRTPMTGLAKVSFTSVYQRQIDELFLSARYASQAITLRLTALGLYLKQLKGMRDAVRNANAMNEANLSKFTTTSGIFRKKTNTTFGIEI